MNLRPKNGVVVLQTCPKGFGLKLGKLGLKIPLKNKLKQKVWKSFGQNIWPYGKSRSHIWEEKGLIGKKGE